MESLPLHKVRKIIDYWMELTLPMEAREKRMREKGDAAAQKVFDMLISGQMAKPEVEKDPELGRDKQDSGTLDRFLALGLSPEMLNKPKS